MRNIPKLAPILMAETEVQGKSFLEHLITTRLHVGYFLNYYVSDWNNKMQTKEGAYAEK